MNYLDQLIELDFFLVSVSSPELGERGVRVQKILFYFDHRAAAMKILPWLTGLASQFGATVYVVSVAPDLTALSNFYPPHTRFQEKVTYKTASQLKAFVVEHLQDFFRVETRLGIGRVEELILAVARQEQIGLIIMGSSGRFTLERLLWGNVVEKVVKEAPCPVLLVQT